MKIQSLNFNNGNYNRQISHKATFPVVHWIAEANGEYTPIGEKEAVRVFQTRLIRMLKSNFVKTYNNAKREAAKLNKPDISLKERKEIERKVKSLYEILDVPAQRLRTYLANVDIDYRLNPTVRSFYNNVYGSADSYSPTAYVITRYVKDFEKEYCNEYGKQRKLKLERIKKGATEEEATTQEYLKEKNKYLYGGLEYVNYYPRRIKNSKGETMTLHTKFIIEKDIF